MVRSELIDELQRRAGCGHVWLRNTAPPKFRAEDGPQGKSRLIAALGARALSASARREGFGQNHSLLGVHDFSADAAAYAQHLQRWLFVAGTADLLMCHPSLAFDGPDPIIEGRVVEFEVLSGNGFGQWLTEAGIVLQPMSRTLDVDNGLATF